MRKRSKSVFCDFETGKCVTVADPKFNRETLEKEIATLENKKWRLPNTLTK